MALTESQIYQLNMLTYAGFDGGAIGKMGDAAQRFLTYSVQSGGTVGDYVVQLRQAFGNEPSKYDQTFDRILADPALCDMNIAGYRQMEGSQSNMIVFTSEASSEAVVAFEGSQSAGDWRDNFDGVGRTDAADGVSTRYQERALDFAHSGDIRAVLAEYDSVITTGHSKGGNNAAYVALKSDLVDRCVTFDAPGFSDEFVSRYADRIAMKQDLIDNYCAETDYVNILQNSVGDQHYIRFEIPQGYESCIDGESMPEFFLAHEPVALQNYFYDGKPEVPQDPGLRAVDDMLNSYLRQADGETKKTAATALGDLLARGFYDGFSGYEFKGKNMLALLDMLGYCIAYFNAYPDQAELVMNAIGKSHPLFVGVLQHIADSPLGRRVLGSVKFAAWLFNLDVKRNGADMKIASAGSRHDHILIDTDEIEGIRNRLRVLRERLDACRGAIKACAQECDDVNFIMSLTLTLHFIFSSGLQLRGTPEAVLRDVASSIGECCSGLDAMNRQLAGAIALLNEREDDNAALAAGLSVGVKAPHL